MKQLIVKSLMLGMAILMHTAMFNKARAQGAAGDPKIVAVINKADWCPVCKANGPRVMKEVVPATKGLSVVYVANDLTDDDSKASSKAHLEQYGVYDAVKNYKATGMIYLVDFNTKKVVKTISVKQPTDKIVKTITKAEG